MSRVVRCGFTLIELSIVLVIIGLIVGGVLVGRDLIEAAMIHKQISQLDQLKVAITTFSTKYNDLPGDVRAANAASFGMTPRSGAAGHGDGNGVLDACDNSSASFLGCESALFWNDLSTAGLISQSFTAATDTELAVTSDQLDNFLPAAVLGYNPVAGRNHIAAFSNSAVAVHDGAPFLAQCSQRICFALIPLGQVSTGLFGYFPDDAAWNSVVSGVSPAEAFAIDTKMDDGKPLTGSVLGGSLDDNSNLNIVDPTSNLYILQGWGTLGDFPCLVMDGDGSSLGDYRYAVQSPSAACSMNFVAY